MEKEEESGERYIRWFSQLGKDDLTLAGGKGANLGEMTRAKIPVPQGFVITTEGYSYFLDKTGIAEKIYSLLSKTDIEDTAELDETAKRIKKIIMDSEMPKDLQEAIIENYETMNIDKDVLERATSDALSILKKGHEPVFVAVRSSATAEDTGAASFAGQQETFLNVKGKSELIDAIKKCWASLFGSRSIYYRIKKGFKHEEVLIAVVIQLMVNSDKSGVMFSKDPMERGDNLVIEAVYGLGEGIVSGMINPDHNVVSRDLKILEKTAAEKKIAIVRNSSGKNEVIKLTPERSKSLVLSDYEIKKLAMYGIELEEHYGKPQDTEFAIDSGNICIVQTRPITTLETKQDRVEIEGKEILKGIPASPGIASGPVRIVHDLSELSKIKKGDVLVTKMTNPDMVVAMQKSTAIVTDEGGVTAHAAIVSREMGIPCVVGTNTATQLLKDGQEITVNGSAGKVYAGRHEAVKKEIKKVVSTQTKLKVIVDLPPFASRAAETGIKHVGLTRIEGIIAESGKHPFFFVKEGHLKDYEEVVFKGVSDIAEYFDELWIRTSDIRSDEYKNLEGAPKKFEANPMLGMHGIRFSLKHRGIMESELKALQRVAKKGKTIGLILPQVISLSEVQETKKILNEIGFAEAKLGIMVETPAAVQIIEDLCKEGIAFISFGTNDLTQYTLAIDRGEDDLQPLYNEMHPAMLSQIKYVIRVCKRYGVESSICGQAGSNKDMVTFLVKQGIDSISMNADAAGELSEMIAEMEKQGLRGSESKDIKINPSQKPAQDRPERLVAKQAKIEGIDNLKEIAEKGKEIQQDFKREQKQEAQQQAEEFPDMDIGIDIFQQH